MVIGRDPDHLAARVPFREIIEDIELFHILGKSERWNSEQY
jgi:hypothetical protein